MAEVTDSSTTAFEVLKECIKLELPIAQTRPINIPVKANYINSDQSPMTPNFPNTPPPTPELSSIPPTPAIKEEVVPPNWLNSKYLETALRSKHPDIEVRSLNLKPAVNFGENYVSIVWRAEVETNQGPFALIIKCVPEVEFRQKLVTDNDLSVREILFYDSFLPKLCENIKPSDVPSTPKCYYVYHDGPNDVIILQDLRPHGYRTADRKQGLNKQHCNIAIKELAKLHALSIKLRIEKPEEFKKLIFEQYTENFYVERNRETFSAFLNNAFKTTAKIIRDKLPYRYHKLGEIIEKLADNAFDMMLEVFKYPENEKYLVFNHGDFWVNNILFKYQSTESNEPLACSLIDFQIAKCGPPVFDLQYFLYTSTTKCTRDQYLNEFLQTYLDQVNQQLKSIGVKFPLPENMFYDSVDDIRKSMKGNMVFGMISAITIMPCVVAEPENAMDMNEMTDEKVKTDLTPFEKLYGGELFKVRIAEILDDFDNLGFFDTFKDVLLKQ